MISKRVLPLTVKEKKNLFVFIQNPLLCDMELKYSNLLDAIVEIGITFRYEETQVNENIIKQVVEFKFPKK